MNEYIQLSHNDMDGAGCSIVMQYKFYIESTIHTSYNDIISNLHIIDEMITHNTKSVFITDLSFDENCFKELIKLTLHHPHTKFIYIDHHPYEGKLGKILNKIQTLENVQVVHSVEYSATKHCLDYINSIDNSIYTNNTDVKNQSDKNTYDNLKKLVMWIDAFDVWRKDSELFKIGWKLNTIFWEIKMNGFKFNLINNNYIIPVFFDKMYDDVIKKKNNMYIQMKKKNLFIKDSENNILIAFSDLYKTFFQIDFPTFDFYILPYISKNNISIRISENVKNSEIIKDEILKYISTYKFLISAGGHPYAFGITIDPSAPKDDIFEIIQNITDIINKHK